MNIEHQKNLYGGHLLMEKIGLTAPDCTSNLLTPTSKNRVFDSENPVLYPSKTVVSIMRGRPLEKPLKSIAGYPYRPATLFPTDQDIRKTWYITFYAYDILDGVMVRKRVLKEDINAIRNLEERIRFCNKTIEEINYFLKRDYHIVK